MQGSPTFRIECLMIWGGFYIIIVEIMCAISVRKGDEWQWFPKHWEISWAPQRSHIWWLQDTSWARRHPSLSLQVSAALLPLSCYQNQLSSAAENLAGDTFFGPNNSQTKIKCYLKTEMPKEGNPRRISTSGSCPLLHCLSCFEHQSDS